MSKSQSDYLNYANYKNNIYTNKMEDLLSVVTLSINEQHNDPIYFLDIMLIIICE